MSNQKPKRATRPGDFAGVHPKNDNHGSSKLKELYVEQGETEMMPKVNEMKEQMKTYMQEIATLKEKENSLNAEWKRGCTECNGNPME